MNKFLTILFLSLGLASCNSCSKKEDVHTKPAPTVVIPPVATSQVIDNDRFKLTIPADWNKKENPLDSNIQAMYSNEESESLIMVASQPFVSTLASYDEFVILAIRELKDNNVKVLSSSEEIINGINFVLLKTERDNIIAYMWLTVQDGFSYQVSCGSQTTDIKPLCQMMVNTFFIKK